MFTDNWSIPRPRCPLGRQVGAYELNLLRTSWGANASVRKPSRRS